MSFSQDPALKRKLSSIEESDLRETIFGVPPKKQTEPLIGWRTWRIVPNAASQWVLKSMSANYIWESPVGRTRNNERLTKDREHHGVYSYKTPNLMLQHLGLLSNIAGRMDLTGHVVEHEFGYRAQRATIRELWIFDQGRPFQTNQFVDTEKEIEQITSDLESRYQCPVHVVKADQLYYWADYMTEEYK